MPYLRWRLVSANFGLFGVNPHCIWLIQEKVISVSGSLALRAQGQQAEMVAGDGVLGHQGRRP